MTKQIEALKLALEALEWIAAQRTGGMIQRKAMEGSTALREALASQGETLAAQQEPIKGKNYEQGLWSMRNYEAMIEDGNTPQPAQQEPVAWTTGLYGGYCVIRSANPASILPLNMALYTSPPARKPLTDEDIDTAWREATGGSIVTEDMRAFARTVYGIKE